MVSVRPANLNSNVEENGLTHPRRENEGDPTFAALFASLAPDCSPETQPASVPKSEFVAVNNIENATGVNGTVPEAWTESQESANPFTLDLSLDQSQLPADSHDTGMRLHQDLRMHHQPGFDNALPQATPPSVVTRSMPNSLTADQASPSTPFQESAEWIPQLSDRKTEAKDQPLPSGLLNLRGQVSSSSRWAKDLTHEQQSHEHEQNDGTSDAELPQIETLGLIGDRSGKTVSSNVVGSANLVQHQQTPGTGNEALSVPQTIGQPFASTPQPEFRATAVPGVGAEERMEALGKYVASQVTHSITSFQVTALPSGTSELSIQIYPVELGQVRIVVSSEAEQIQARILVSEYSTTELLVREKPQLVAALREQGIDLPDIDISYRNASHQHRQDEEQGTFEGHSRTVPAAISTEKPFHQNIVKSMGRSSSIVDIVA